MKRLATLLVLALLVAAPLASCGKKGDPLSDPPTAFKTYPKPDRTVPQ
jgi:predicted small lipoprotein YifL